MADPPDLAGVDCEVIDKFLRLNIEGRSYSEPVTKVAPCVPEPGKTPDPKISRGVRVVLGPDRIMIPMVAEPLTVTHRDVFELVDDLKDIPMEVFDEYEEAMLNGVNAKIEPLEEVIEQATIIAKVDTEMDSDLRMATYQRKDEIFNAAVRIIDAATTVQLARGIVVYGSQSLLSRIQAYATSRMKSHGQSIRVAKGEIATYTRDEHGMTRKQFRLIREIREQRAFLRVFPYDFLDLPHEGSPMLKMLAIVSAQMRANAAALSPLDFLRVVWGDDIILANVAMASACSDASRHGSAIMKKQLDHDIYGFTDGTFVHHAINRSTEVFLASSLYRYPVGNPINDLFRMMIIGVGQYPGEEDFRYVEKLCSRSRVCHKRPADLEFFKPEVTGHLSTASAVYRAPCKGELVVCVTRFDKASYTLFALSSKHCWSMGVVERPVKFVAVSGHKLVPWFIMETQFVKYPVSKGILYSGDSDVIAVNTFTCFGGLPRFMTYSEEIMTPEWELEWVLDSRKNKHASREEKTHFSLSFDPKVLDWNKTLKRLGQSRVQKKEDKKTYKRKKVFARKMKEQGVSFSFKDLDEKYQAVYATDRTPTIIEVKPKHIIANDKEDRKRAFKRFDSDVVVDFKRACQGKKMTPFKNVVVHGKTMTRKRFMEEMASKGKEKYEEIDEEEVDSGGADDIPEKFSRYIEEPSPYSVMEEEVDPEDSVSPRGSPAWDFEPGSPGYNPTSPRGSPGGSP
jgi:hypothetical protein